MCYILFDIHIHMPLYLTKMYLTVSSYVELYILLFSIHSWWTMSNSIRHIGWRYIILHYLIRYLQQQGRAHWLPPPPFKILQHVSFSHCCGWDNDKRQEEGGRFSAGTGTSPGTEHNAVQYPDWLNVITHNGVCWGVTSAYLIRQRCHHIKAVLN